MFRRLFFTLSIGFLLSAGCAGPGVGPDAPSSQPAGGVEVTLFHTNDLHAHFLPQPARWRDDRALVGGFEALESVLRKERESAGPALYLDAGDFMTGTPLSDLEYRGAFGGAIVEFYNQVGLDAMTIGNHEFDRTMENIHALIDLAEFPVFAANLRDTEGNSVTGDDYRIFELGDVKVGVIGITTEKLYGLISAKKREILNVETGIETLQRLVPEIDPKTDLIVVLSHEGVETDREIAREVSGIDLIIGGHSHTRIEEGEYVNGVLILQAGAQGRYLGRADLLIENDAIVEADCRLIATWAEGAEATKETRDLVEMFAEQIDEEFGMVIAEAPEDMDRCYYCESDLGNWITDRMREVSEADVALLNSGGIRKDILAGSIKKLDIQEVLPFTNMLCQFRCTGAELLAIARHNATAEATEAHGILQVSGLEYSWSKNGETIEIPVALVGGQLIDPDAVYTVISVDYVAQSQPEKYLGYVPETIEAFGSTLTAAVMETTARIGRIEAPPKDRIRHVDFEPEIESEQAPAATSGE